MLISLFLPISPAEASSSGGSGGEVNVGAIAGGASAAIVVVLIAAGVLVLVWLVRRHRKMTSLQTGNKCASINSLSGDVS